MKNIYFAGALFTHKDLVGNKQLAEKIDLMSGDLHCILPQELEQRDTSPISIRDHDIKALMECDLGLFNFDGTEVDSGTVVEFMLMKFLDIPCVILRTDFRAAGDGGDPWNLMMSFYPRTKNVILDSLGFIQEQMNSGIDPNDACNNLLGHTAVLIIKGFNELEKTTPILEGDSRFNTYEWVRKMVGESFNSIVSEDDIVDIIASKISKGVL